MGHDGCVAVERIGQVAENGGLDDVLRRLAVRRDIPRPPRVSTSDHVVAVLSQAILEGELPPGTQLSEERIGGALQVSRNTLREGFRLLSHDGLLVHQRHRGVFVPVFEEADLVDLYELRIVLEVGVLRSIVGVGDEQLRELDADVRVADEAARRGRWHQVGTANMDFHQHLLSLSGSPRMARVGRQVLAQTRLAFLSLAQPRTLHEPFIGRNRTLVGLLAADRVAEAAEALEGYLRDSREQLLGMLREERR